MRLLGSLAHRNNGMERESLSWTIVHLQNDPVLANVLSETSVEFATQFIYLCILKSENGKPELFVGDVVVWHIGGMK